MKVDIERNVSTNIHGAVEFKTTADAHKLFAMLSDYLYADKEFCVLYELSTNAADEHLECGQSRPFDVILPTTLSPKLIIRDYGRGLHEKQVYELLATYGASAKNQTNESVGGWGIGFKSVAAVSSTWNIISRNNGLESSYLVFVNERGIPAITKIVEKALTEETGLEIQIPIATGRENVWQQLITKVYKHFPIKPSVANYQYQKIEWSEPKVLIQGDQWYLSSETRSYGSSSAICITSHREYSFNKDKLREAMDKKFTFMLDMPFVFTFPIGSLDLAISREVLQYTDKTITAINAIFENAFTKIFGMIESELNKAVDELQYRELIFKTVPIVFGKGAQLQYNDGARTFFKRVIDGKYGIKELPEDAQQLIIPLTGKGYCYNGKVLQQLKNKWNCWKTYTAVVNQKVDRTLNKVTTHIAVKIDRLDKCEFYLKDCYDAGARIRTNHNGKFMILLEKNTFPKVMKNYVKKASSLPKGVRTASTRQQATGEYYQLWRKTFTKTKIDKSSFSYCWINAQNVRDHNWMDRDLLSKIHIMDNLGYKILGFKAGTYIPPGINSIDVEIKHKLDKLLKSKELINEGLQYAYGQLCTYNYSSSHQYLWRKMAKVKTTKPSIWNTIRDEISDVLDHSIKSGGSRSVSVTAQYNRLAEVCGVKPLEHKFDFKVNDNYNKIISNYPLLRHMADDWTDSEVLNYLEQCGV